MISVILRIALIQFIGVIVVVARAVILVTTADSQHCCRKLWVVTRLSVFALLLI